MRELQGLTFSNGSVLEPLEILISENLIKNKIFK